MTRLKAALLVIATFSLSTVCAPLRAEESSTKPAETVEIPLNPLPFDLKGYLRRPNGAGPSPGVVLVPACGGTYVDRDWGETLSSWGYVALTLDIFTAHGLLGRTACFYPDRANPELAEDAYRGLNLLIERKLVDPRRVFIMGFARSGSLAFAAVDRDGIMRNAKHKFRGAIALYPPCGDAKGVMAVPTLVMVGARDEATLDRCRKMAAGEDDMGISRQPNAGAPIQFVVLPDAYSAFDVPTFQKPVDIQGFHLEYSKQATDKAKDILRQFLRTIADTAQ